MRVVEARATGWQRVISLLELMRILQAEFLVTWVQRLEELKHQIPDGKVRIKRSWNSTIDEYYKLCSKHGLRVARHFMRDVSMYFNATSTVDGKQVKECISRAQEATYSELEAELFLHIPREKITLFEAKDLFGAGVAAKFPSAMSDVAEAGRCLALDRNPASVFHVMRVAEAGLRVIAKRLQVGYARRSWGDILRDIDDKLNARPPQDPLKTQVGEAYRYLKDIKGLWRDTTMHVGEDFSPERAEYIFASVRAFMQGLEAKGLSEESAA